MSAEKHQKTTVASVTDVMFAIFNMVTTAGQTAVRWADNTDTHAIFNGTGFVAIGSVTSSAFFTNTSSYMVIESSALMPSGSYRWQAKISRGSGDGHLYVNFAPRGSWNYATPAFNTATYPTTGNIDAFNGTTIGTSRVLVSACDMDSYGSSVPYAYLRVLMWEASGTVIDKGFYVGGYIPFDQTNNLNPASLLAKNPTLSGAAVSWSYPNANGNSLNRISPEYTGATLSLAAAGYAHVKALDTSIVNRDPNGNWTDFPVYCRCADDSSFFGYFGKYTMFSGDTSRSIGTADSAHEYLSVNDLVMRWKP